MLSNKSLKFPIIGLITMITLLVTGTFYLFSSHFISQTIIAEEKRAAESSATWINSFFTQDAARLAGLARLIKDEPLIIDGIMANSRFNDDIGVIKEIMDLLYDKMAVNVLRVSAIDGRIIYRAHQRGKQWRNDYQRPIGLQDAAAGRKEALRGRND